MSDETKREVYQSADALLLPCYSETAACFTEATSFGLPIVTTRIHHGDEFVRDGVTGFLLDALLFIYSPDYGKRWKTAEEFWVDLEAMRERGDLEPVVEQAVDRLDAMISGRMDVEAMRRSARDLHAERFPAGAQPKTDGDLRGGVVKRLTLVYERPQPAPPNA